MTAILTPADTDLDTPGLAAQVRACGAHIPAVARSPPVIATTAPHAPTPVLIIDKCRGEPHEHMRGYLSRRNGRNTVGHGREEAW